MCPVLLEAHLEARAETYLALPAVHPAVKTAIVGILAKRLVQRAAPVIKEVDPVAVEILAKNQAVGIQIARGEQVRARAPEEAVSRRNRDPEVTLATKVIRTRLTMASHMASGALKIGEPVLIRRVRAILGQPAMPETKAKRT
jgi:hypothetical protein